MNFPRPHPPLSGKYLQQRREDGSLLEADMDIHAPRFWEMVTHMECAQSSTVCAKLWLFNPMPRDSPTVWPNTESGVSEHKNNTEDFVFMLLFHMAKPPLPQLSEPTMAELNVENYIREKCIDPTETIPVMYQKAIFQHPLSSDWLSWHVLLMNLIWTTGKYSSLSLNTNKTTGAILKLHLWRKKNHEDLKDSNDSSTAIKMESLTHSCDVWCCALLTVKGKLRRANQIRVIF